MGRPKDPNNTLHKKCPTCNTEFTCERRNEKTYCCKKCSCNSPEVKEKNRMGVKKTFEDKYGGHAMKNTEVKENFKRSMKEKYGVEHYSQIGDEWKNKIKSTLKEKYGDENYNNIEQMKKTCIDRYGVDNPLKCESIKNQVMESKADNHYDYLKSICSDLDMEILFSREEYIGNGYENKYKFKCLKCNNTFQSDVYLIKHINCETCNPTSNSDSEDGVYNFIKELLPDEIVIRRDRTILNGYELDIYLPNKKMAIEFNGLYWHSEHKGKIKKHYHLNKTNKCVMQGIRLIHIYENEWKFKQNIIKSILQNILGKSNTTFVYGRKCEVKKIESGTSKIFLSENHLQGEDKSPIQFGLFFNEELISVMTFMKSRFDKKFEWELSRYSVKSNYNIIGGAQKLLSAFKKEYNPRSIVTYSDRRYFYGEIYSKLGFNFIHHTPPNYYYISKDYKMLYNRMNFQKKRLPELLENFDINLTEWENMKNNGYDRIWDCGVSKWGWTNY